MFNERLRELRKSSGLSQEKMCSELNKKYGLQLERSMISKWETGFQEPQIYNLVCIADFFGVPIDYLTEKTNGVSWNTDSGDPYRNKKYISSETLSGKILSIMKYRKISLDEFAMKMGISESSLRNLIDNSELIDEETLERMCKILEVESYVFSGYATFTDDEYDNYIGFLSNKVDDKLPLTPYESRVLEGDINDNPINPFKNATSTQNVSYAPSDVQQEIISIINNLSEERCQQVLKILEAALDIPKTE